MKDTRTQETFTQSVISRYPALFDISDAGDDAIARYGIEIFPGWFSIVERMVDQINTFANQRNYIGPLKITQIKSKFCTLRCATNIQDDDLGQIIGQYEKQASETCEQCGMPGKIRMNRQWKMVLCAVCEMKG